MASRRLLNPSSILFCACVFIILSVCGCGRKGAPVPPGTLRPETITDLSFSITPDGARLSWSLPVRNRDGSPLAGIKGFELFKQEVEAEKACDGCPPRFGRPIWIPFKGRYHRGQKMIYEDRTLKEGFEYTYEIQTVKGIGNRSDTSNRISFIWHTPPLPPTLLAGRIDGEHVKLSWSAPGAWPDGTPVTAEQEKNLLYRVYRSERSSNKWKPLSPLTGRENFVDRFPEETVSVRYRVASVFRYRGTEIEGDAGSAVIVTRTGGSVPPVPEKLVAIYSKNGTELTWEVSGRRPAAGFFVYRMGPYGLIDRINQKPVGVTRFVDRTRLEPGTYTYWVTAAGPDGAGRQGPPSNFVEIQVK